MLGQKAIKKKSLFTMEIKNSLEIFVEHFCIYPKFCQLLFLPSQVKYLHKGKASSKRCYLL